MGIMYFNFKTNLPNSKGTGFLTPSIDYFSII